MCEHMDKNMRSFQLLALIQIGKILHWQLSGKMALKNGNHTEWSSECLHIISG